MKNSITPISRRHVLIAGGAMATVAGLPILVAGQSKPASGPAPQRKNQGEAHMNTITAKDGTQIFYKDWGKGPVVTFSHGWPLNADAWDPQMLFLVQHGYRCVAVDRRGHGRSTQTSVGNDMDTYADDLAAVVDYLDLDGMTM